MKIGIIGAGAIGSLLSFYLSGVNEHEVWLLSGWQEHIATIRQHGLFCECDGHVAVRPARVTSDPVEIGWCDVVFIVVKSYQTQRAASQATLLVHNTTLVVTLQNGIGNWEELTQRLGADYVTQGVTLLGATLIGPGRVRHAGMGPTYFGAAPESALPNENSIDGLIAGAAPTTPSSRAEQAERMAYLNQLVALFNTAGLPAEQRIDIETLVWHKLVVNVGINALTALLRVPNGILSTVPSARVLVNMLVAEAAAVAAARGVALPADLPAHVCAIAEATAHNRSSMLQDIVRGNQTEIAAINGAIVREGARLRIPTPYNQLISALVMALDAVSAYQISDE